MSKEIKNKIRRKVVAQLTNLFAAESPDTEILKQKVTQIAEDTLQREATGLSLEEKKRIIHEIVDELTGLGPLESLLKDPLVTEIMINGPRKVFVERSGNMELTNITFDDDTQIMYIVNKMLAPTRRHVDESSPFTEISLLDGSRVNIIIPPLALGGPTVTIRKFLKNINNVDDLIKLGTMDRRMADLLVACIRAKINIIFAGATGAGKTTTLNVLSSYISPKERVVTIEDTAELHLTQDHVVRLETRQASIEGKGEITIRDLFKNSLRMRPDRIILGEIRGNEALDMLQAICSGHGGSLSVIHSDSPEDIIYRLEAMILASGLPITLEAIHRHIAASLNLIVQQEQLTDGSRRVTRITQVNGLKDGQAVLEDIFVYEIDHLDPEGRVYGKWKATGVIPVFYPVFKKYGVTLPQEIFNKD